MTSTLSFRCQCELCNDENLVGAREFRCCKEVANASAKMAFDGSTERITCITQHDDYVALTNRTVLLQVAPLLRDKNGRTYRRRTGVPENEWVQFCHEEGSLKSCLCLRTNWTHLALTAESEGKPYILIPGVNVVF